MLALTVPLGLDLPVTLDVTEVLAVAVTEDDAEAEVEPLKLVDINTVIDALALTDAVELTLLLPDPLQLSPTELLTLPVLDAADVEASELQLALADLLPGELLAITLALAPTVTEALPDKVPESDADAVTEPLLLVDMDAAVIDGIELADPVELALLLNDPLLLTLTKLLPDTTAVADAVPD